MKKLFLIFILIAILLAGCINTNEIPQNNSKLAVITQDSSFGAVYRFIDEDYNIICYTAYKGGIDCFPLDELK